MSRELRPGETFTQYAENFDTGRVGFVGFRIEDKDGNVVVARSTTGVSEPDPGVYTKDLVAPIPATATTYLVVVDDPDLSLTGYDEIDVLPDLPSESGVGLTPFVSRQDLTAYLGRDVTDDDGALIAVDAACDVCRSLAEQQFNAGTTTVTLDGSGTDALLLPQLPVNAAGTVLVDGGTVTDYALASDGVLLRKANATSVADWNCLPQLVWPARRQNIEVTYEHGYSVAELPRDIRMVALSVASRLIVQGPALQESNGNASIRYGVNATDLTNGEKAILRKYRR